MEIVNPEIEAYAEAHTSPEAPHLTALAEATHEFTDAWGMMVGRLEGGTLAMFVHMLRPARVLELGTFTGYSSLSMAAALPPGGRIITCELSDRHADFAQRHIDASPYADRIEIRRGPALETLAGLEGPFDFVFIDAHKPEYPAYLDAVLPLLSDRGVIAVDNVLWSGGVLNPEDRAEDTVAIRALNERVASDPALECVMLTVRDGLMLIRKR